MYITVKLVIPVETGNLPYNAVPYELTIPQGALSYLKKSSAWDVLMEAKSGLNGHDEAEYVEDLLIDGLLHMCGRPDLYLKEFPFDIPYAKEIGDYQEAIYYLSNLIVACKDYPMSTVKIVDNIGGNNA